MRGVRRLMEVPAGEVIRAKAKGRNAAGVNGSKSQKNAAGRACGGLRLMESNAA